MITAVVVAAAPRLLLPLLAVAGGTAADVTPPSPADLTGPWQLFVDDERVQNMSKTVRRRYHQFTKHAGNPVLSDARVR